MSVSAARGGMPGIIMPTVLSRANGGSMMLPPPGGAGSLALPVGGTRVGGGSMQLAPGHASNRRVDPNKELPDPASVHKQKEQFALDIEDQLRQGIKTLGTDHKKQLELLHSNANQEKQRFNLVLDQQVKREELFLSQQYNEQLMRLQQAAQAQRAGLEKQACGLILEYQQKKVQEECLAQQAGIQKQHEEAQSKLIEEMHKIGAPVSSPMNSNLSAMFAGVPLNSATSTPVLTNSSFAGLMGSPSGGGLENMGSVAAAAYSAPPLSSVAASAVKGGVLQYVPPLASERRAATPSRQTLGAYPAPFPVGNIRSPSNSRPPSFVPMQIAGGNNAAMLPYGVTMLQATSPRNAAPDMRSVSRRPSELRPSDANSKMRI